MIIYGNVMQLEGESATATAAEHHLAVNGPDEVVECEPNE